VKQKGGSVRTVIRPSWKPTEEQLALLAEARAAWQAAKKAEELAWRTTQALRDAGVPDVAIEERIDEVSRPTLNRRLGPRQGRSA
jgi:hypothetical protein